MRRLLTPPSRLKKNPVAANSPVFSLIKSQGPVVCSPPGSPRHNILFMRFPSHGSVRASVDPATAPDPGVRPPKASIVVRSTRTLDGVVRRLRQHHGISRTVQRSSDLTVSHEFDDVSSLYNSRTSGVRCPTAGGINTIQYLSLSLSRDHGGDSQ